MSISIILGTRPEIVKFSPIIRECIRLNQDFSMIHTGQHYSYNMDRIFFEQLKLPQAANNLEIGSGTHAKQTGKMLIGIEKMLLKEKPEVVLVEGDTNTALSGSLAAAKLQTRLGHVEAGLRSYDRQMPEEINRVLADHCADLLFAPTANSKMNLLEEGIPEDRIFVTGNTVVDAVFQNVKLAEKKAQALKELDLQSSEYFLVTVHRQENVDNPSRFAGILKGLQAVSEKYELPMVYPIHPRAKKKLKQHGLKPRGIRMTSPLDYLSFLRLQSEARLVLTDSGGVQEETCILHVPCVTLRDNTERPETLQVKSNILAGTNPERIAKCVDTMLNRKRKWKNPFGDGKAGQRIVKILRGKIPSSKS